MTEQSRSLPHHNLIAYAVAVDLLRAVHGARIRDAGLRDQAMRAAKSAGLNIAEGAGRVSKPDKARAYAIARGEAGEAAAAVELAACIGAASRETADRCGALASRLVALLTGLIGR
jgi:four helix bundle protein